MFDERRPVACPGGCQSEADQFRQYAEEALHWASQAKSEKERRVLREFARTWSQAALASESIVWWSTTVRQSTGPLAGAADSASAVNQLCIEYA
jgi:hypothetical protein